MLASDFSGFLRRNFFGVIFFGVIDPFDSPQIMRKAIKKGETISSLV